MAKLDHATNGRVLVAKVGLDGHDVGARVIARGLAEAGFEVIYTGIRQTVEQIVTTAKQEDVQVVGVSLLSGAHLHFVPQIAARLKHEGMDDVLLIVGGVIPQEDIPKLLDKGVSRVFLADTRIGEVAQYLIDEIGRRAVS